jgi:hypothetical protein
MSQQFRVGGAIIDIGGYGGIVDRDIRRLISITVDDV